MRRKWMSGRTTATASRSSPPPLVRVALSPLREGNSKIPSTLHTQLFVSHRLTHTTARPADAHAAAPSGITCWHGLAAPAVAAEAPDPRDSRISSPPVQASSKLTLFRNP